MKILYIIPFTLATGMLVSFDFTSKSEGAPVSATGAPNEITCATSGCHDDNVPNLGSAVISIESNTLETGYVPGETYPVTVKIEDSDVVRFGYQLVVLDEAGNNVGDIQIIDPVRTQTMFNHLELTDREYATYTYEGTSAVQTGLGEWTINWVAPESNLPVTFYVACVSADNDGTDEGDVVYTTQKTVLKSVNNSISENQPSINVRVDNRMITFSNAEGEDVSIFYWRTYTRDLFYPI